MPTREPAPQPDANTQYVLDRILRAFAKVQLGDGLSIRQTKIIDDHGPIEAYKAARARDACSDWKAICDEVIENHHGVAFLDAQGLVYHLPAYMSFALRNYRTSKTCSIDFTIYALGRKGEYFDLLTASQKAAIRHFLKFMIHHAGRHCDTGHAKKALETIWKVPPQKRAD
jgi:hypothetical protein